MSPFVRIWLLALIHMGLDGCNSAPDEDTTKTAVSSAAFPADDLNTYLDGYKIEIPKAERFLWNNQEITEDTLRIYLKELGGRGRIVVQFEPGTPANRMLWVREQVIEAGYCKRSLCAEAPWKAVRPFIN